MKYLPIVMCLLAIGCEKPAPKIIVDVPALVDYTPFLAWQIDKLPDVAPVPPKVKVGDICPVCNGTGKVGDTVTVLPCKDCKADGRVDKGDPILGVGEAPEKSILVTYYIEYKGKEYTWNGRSFTSPGQLPITFTNTDTGIEGTESISICQGTSCQVIPIQKR